MTNEHRAVNTMIADGIPFEYIENYINGLRLPSEQLGALWLLAWAEATDPDTRQRVVAETLAGTGVTPLPAVLRQVARGRL